LYAFVLSKGLGVDKNVPEARKFFLRAIELGDTRAMFNYESVLLDEGDAVQANEYFLQAAERGMVPAQFKVAEHSEQAIGMDRDPQLAREYYQMVANNGSPTNRYRAKAEDGMRRLNRG
jgi:TPR repeat protein